MLVGGSTPCICPQKSGGIYIYYGNWYIHDWDELSLAQTLVYGGKLCKQSLDGEWFNVSGYDRFEAYQNSLGNLMLIFNILLLVYSVHLNFFSFNFFLKKNFFFNWSNLLRHTVPFSQMSYSSPNINISVSNTYNAPETCMRSIMYNLTQPRLALLTPRRADP